MGLGGIKSGPHACLIDSLPTEMDRAIIPSPRSASLSQILSPKATESMWPDFPVGAIICQLGEVKCS